ncbi:type I restriction endonuclease, partial [Thiolapillus sp.]|uniref:type I restriction endonuclease n=4 Tax=Thiolapillus sp. TaxID=2017437 RepID=UPI003AF5C9F4
MMLSLPTQQAWAADFAEIRTFFNILWFIRQENRPSVCIDLDAGDSEKGKGISGERMTKENDIEQRLLTKLQDLKYTYRPDIRDREALEQNFREKFEALNRVNLTDAEFSRLLEGIISPDTFACAETLRHRNTFEREDGTPLHYQLVNLKDWCKNSFEV